MNDPRVYDAPIQSDGPIPAYKVIKVDGPFIRERTIFDEKSKQLIKQETKIDEAYLVLFPRGHSIMLDTLQALRDHGFGEVVPLITLGQEAELNQDHVGKRKTIQRGIETA